MARLKTGGRSEGYLLGTITPGAQKVSKADTVDDRRGAAAAAEAEHNESKLPLTGEI